MGSSLSIDFLSYTTCTRCVFSNATSFMPPQFEEWWRGIKCYPCPCVRACVRPCVRPSVRPLSKFGVHSPLNNILKTAIQIWYVDI